MGNETDLVCFDRYLFSQIYSLIWCITTIGLFIFFFITTIQLRHAFHPFFSFYFSSLIFLYIGCMFSELILRVFELNLYSGILTEIALAIQNFTIFATIIHRYEYSRNYPLFGISIIFAVGFFVGFMKLALTSLLAFNEFGADYVFEMALIVQALISLLCMFILYFVNRDRTKRLTKCGGGELSLRYQLAENIKAMKALIPFLFLDNLITWNDQLFDILIDVDYLHPPLLCIESNKNLIYLISTTIRSLFCASQSVFILSYHELFRKKFLDIFCKTMAKRPPKFMSRRTQPTCKMKKLSNVLGSEIKLAITQQEYFDMMKTYW